MAKRGRRQRIQLPTCYYEGYLEKWSLKDKTSRKLWTCLCGNTLFFFNEKRDNDYIEKLDLSGLISVTNDSSNLDMPRLNLEMKDGNVKFTAPSTEARELWMAYIHSVAELSLPPSLNLLPGQIHMLREAIEKENERLKNVLPPAVPIPACFCNVSRLEAELLLEREAKRGNLLLRPGRKGNSYAVSTRQYLDSSIYRHYRVAQKPDGSFAIEVDNPMREEMEVDYVVYDLLAKKRVPCATLHDVVNYLVENTKGVLIPLIIEEPYEKNIAFIQSDDENGERFVCKAPTTLVPRSGPPKPAPRSRVFVTVPAQPVEGNEYLNDELEEKEKEPEDSPPVPRPRVDNNAPKKAMMPPTPVPRKSISASSLPPSTSSTNSQAPKMRVLAEAPGHIPLAAMSELKLKLEKKARCQE